MPILHTVNQSPFQGEALQSCLRLARPGSTVLLIEDAVYAGLRGSDAARRLTAAMPDLVIAALRPDLVARGIEAERVAEGIELVDHVGFVRLAASHDAVVSWL